MNAHSVGRNAFRMLYLSRQWMSVGQRSCSTSTKPTDKQQSGSGAATDSDEIVKKELYFENQVLRLIMNDPKKRNALSLRLLETLHKELSSCDSISKLRAIIIAASPPVFSAGHDLRELRTSEGQAKHAQIMAKCSELMNLIQDMQLPVIAEVKGVAAAAGCQLAASCDIVIAADNAKFSVPGAKAGVFCSTPGIALARAVPRKVALDMLLTGDPISAQDALRAGLVSRIVDESKVEEEALSVAEKILALSRPVVGLGKTFFHMQIGMNRHDAYRHGERVMVENLRLADTQEGISAFVEKRQPVWTHKTDKVH
uniref:Enoyl-CoA hydratase domain-containing protein 3, mitochondrial n=1 Tax=Plectus sambesii TaxID=2011161 RepID=A0A914VD73_9BILA